MDLNTSTKGNLDWLNEAPTFSAIGDSHRTSATGSSVEGPAADSQSSTSKDKFTYYADAPAHHNDVDFTASRSTELWYPDGTVVVSVEGVQYRLYRSRLAKYCNYFKALFSASHHAPSSPHGHEHPVYVVPNITRLDFEQFIQILDAPLAPTLADTPTDKALARSLLRASHALSCAPIRAFALAHLSLPWPSPSAPVLADPPPSFPEALENLQLARDIGVPAACKRAMYELLASDSFWASVAPSGSMSACTTEHAAVSDSELVALFAARAWLQEQWRLTVLRAPAPCPDCTRADSLDAESMQGERHRAWLAAFAHLATGETRDVFRAIEGVQALVRGMKLGDGGLWCGGCVEERVRAWEVVRETWWTRLDDFLVV